eukprot:14562604-Alexandrium_andersonii.AAC.1
MPRPEVGGAGRAQPGRRRGVVAPAVERPLQPPLNERVNPPRALGLQRVDGAHDGAVHVVGHGPAQLVNHAAAGGN